MNLGDRVGVVIRSSGERTETLCRELALAQGIGEDQIAIVREAPFPRALRASYEMGIQLGRPWTLCLDADVLLLPGAIADMVTLADRQASSLFEFAGQVLDKFFGGSRGAGHRLYRTALLSEGVECIPLGHNPIRPEWHTIEVMRSRGHPWRHMTYLAGLHDFEQYNRDIFRQCFAYAHKHQKFTELFLSYWRAERSADQDYEVALREFIAGLQFEGELVIDSRHEIIREAV